MNRDANLFAAYVLSHFRIPSQLGDARAIEIIRQNRRRRIAAAILRIGIPAVAGIMVSTLSIAIVRSFGLLGVLGVMLLGPPVLAVAMLAYRYVPSLSTRLCTRHLQRELDEA